MDVRLTGLSSLMFLTAWLTPHKSNTSNFRNVFRPITIAINQSSPAYAALEADRTNVGLVQQTSLVDRTVQYSQLKIRPKPKPIRLRGLIISSRNPTNQLNNFVKNIVPPPSDMTLDQYADYLVQKELARRLAQKTGEQTLKSQFGTPIYVARAGAPATTGILVAKAKVRTVVLSHPPISEYGAEVRQPIRLPAKRYHFSGVVTMANGAGYIEGQQQILIRHEVNGLADSRGKIDVTSGHFAINTDELGGQIVAEVRDQSGALLARGVTDLPAAPIKALNILVSPVFAGAQGEVVSTNALGSRQISIPDSTVVIGGIDRRVPYNTRARAYTDRLLVQPSNYLVEATHDRYWPSIETAESAEKFQVQLFPEKLLESFLQLTLKKYAARDAENLGLIWGKVTMEGAPVEGAKVRIVGENSQTPVYFTGFIPDLARDTTSASGEFAFSALDPIETAVQVTLGAKLFWPVLLPIRSHTVSYADLKIERPRDVDFYCHEAFSNRPLSAAVVPLGTDEEFYVPDQGDRRTNLQTVKGLTLLEAKADGSHAVTRLVFHAHQTAVNFPFIRKDWLEYMAQRSGTTKQQYSTSASMFFITGDDYDVTIGAGGTHSMQKIAFFNSRGQYVSKPVGDGGFLIFGLPQGFQTVTITSNRAPKVVTRLVYVDSYAVAVSSLNLGY